jgi:hypothetical protein
MTSEQINTLLLHNSNFLYCSFELLQRDKEPQIVIFVEMEKYQEHLKQNAWQYVEKTHFRELQDLHNHKLIQVLKGSDVVSLKVFQDNRLSRHKF